MAKQIKIRVFPDGSVQAITENIKGKQCLQYIQPLEKALEARVVDSEFTKDYYEAVEQVQPQIQETEVVKNGQ